MRLRSRDTDYHDEGKRALGLAAFLGELKTFLDDRVEGDGDGWAPVSQEDHGKLYELLKEIIALKWGTDADGDLPFDFHITDRNEYHMVAEDLPYHPYRGQEDYDRTHADLQFIDRATQAAKFLISAAQSLTEQVNNHVRDVQIAQHAAKERDDKIAALHKEIESGTDADYDRLANEVHDMVKTHPDHTTQLPPAMAAKYPSMVEAAINSMVETLLDYQTENDPGFGDHVRTPSLRYSRIFGKAYSSSGRIDDLRKKIKAATPPSAFMKRLAASRGTGTTV